MATPDDNHPGLSCLTATGADVGSFLQGQLSADMDELKHGQLSISGWHNPKGRVRCLLWAGPIDTNTWRIITATDQLEALLGGLNRYVLRAKVHLQTDPDAIVRLLAAGNPTAGTNHWPMPGTTGATLWAGPASLLPQSETLPRGQLVSEGVPLLGPQTAEKFLGPSLNLDLLGGISFTKGCFPGQEVIARIHNRGTIKRRTLKFTNDGTTPNPGESLVDRKGETCGEVVVAGHHSEFLASVQLRKLDQTLFLSTSTTAIQSAPLPYAIPEI